MTNDDLVTVTGYLHATWQSFRPDDATAFALRRNLGDLPVEAVIGAIDSLAREHPQFAPNPQTIAARARELTHGAAPSAADCWGALVAQQRRCGWSGFPHFDDPLVYVVVERLGGWRHICQQFHEPERGRGPGARVPGLRRCGPLGVAQPARGRAGRDAPGGADRGRGDARPACRRGDRRRARTVMGRARLRTA